MGKRKRNNEAHDGQKESIVNGKNRAKEKSRVAGQSMEKGDQSGGKKMFSWTSAQIIVVLKELVKLAKANMSKPLDNSSVNWDQLAAAVGERLEQNVTRTQIYEKARRLKEKYVKHQENMSRGNLSSFKNDDDEKMFKLSHKVWGVGEAPELKPEGEEDDLPSQNVETHSNEGQSRGSVSLSAKAQKTQKERASKDLKKGRSQSNKPEQQSDNAEDINDAGDTSDKEVVKDAGNTSHEEVVKDAGNTSHEEVFNEAGNGFHEQMKPDVKVASQPDMNGSEEGIKRTIEIFHAEHQALLKDVQKSCMTVLQDMEAKFSSVLSRAHRRNQSPWMGFSAPLSPVDMMSRDSALWDKTANGSLSLKGGNQPAAFESLAREWEQQHLQELKLASLKLQLMVDECKRAKEKLEKQVLKS